MSQTKSAATSQTVANVRQCAVDTRQLTEDPEVLVDVRLLPVMEKLTEQLAYYYHCSMHWLQLYTIIYITAIYLLLYYLTLKLYVNYEKNKNI